MAFSTLSTAITLLNDGNLQSGNSAMWAYVGPDDGSAVTATGYLKGVGSGGYGLGTVGLKVGDIFFNIESSAGVTPGRVTLHSVVASSRNASAWPVSSTQGFDCSLSTYAST